MFVYTVGLATSGNFTTSATPNTEVDEIYLKPGARNLSLLGLYLIGKGAGLTSISGIAIRAMTFTTASTSGTTAGKVPKDVNSPACTFTAATGGTISTTGRVNHMTIGCGAAGPGGYVAPNPDAMIQLPGSSAGSIDLVSVSGTASLTHELTCEAIE